MFKTDSFLGNQKIEFEPECLRWSCHYATECFVAFLGDIEIRQKYEKNIFLSSSRTFSLSTPRALWKTVLFVSSRAFSLSIEKIFQKLFKTFYRPWERIIGAEYDTERKCTFLIINQFSVWVCIKSLFQ